MWIKWVTGIAHWNMIKVQGDRVTLFPLSEMIANFLLVHWIWIWELMYWNRKYWVLLEREYQKGSWMLMKNWKNLHLIGDCHIKKFISAFKNQQTGNFAEYIGWGNWREKFKLKQNSLFHFIMVDFLGRENGGILEKDYLFFLNIQSPRCRQDALKVELDRLKTLQHWLLYVKHD